MSFWAWALEVYARPDAAPACLDLQDSHGQSVPYLLWAAWAAHEGRPVTPSALRRGAELAQRWEQAVVGPLRQARRALKAPLAGIADGPREGLRADINVLELNAERMVMTALEDLADASSGTPFPLQAALVQATAAWRVPAPASALSRLAKALG